MYVIQDKLQLQLMLGEKGTGPKGTGVEYPLEGSFISLQLSTQVGMYLPTCRLVLSDKDQIIKSNNALADGAPFRLYLATGVGFENRQLYPMRVFSKTQPQTPQAQGYVVDGYYDYPVFFGSGANKPYKGSSVDVISQMAAECGMQTLVVSSTADSQVWHTHNQRYAKAMWDIALKGYVDATSCMRLVVDDTGVLRYLNITTLKPIKGKPEFVYGSDSTTDFRIVEADPLDTSGGDNFTTGYGHRMIQSRSTGDDLDLSKTSVATGGALLINAKVKGLIAAGGVRRSFEPIDAGNVGDTYTKAMYQNERIANTWSAGAKILVGRRTGLQCLDPIMVKFAVPGPGAIRKEGFHSGPHIVCAKTIYITGGNYYEVLEVRRNSTNLQ